MDIQESGCWGAHWPKSYRVRTPNIPYPDFAEQPFHASWEKPLRAGPMGPGPHRVGRILMGIMLLFGGLRVRAWGVGPAESSKTGRRPLLGPPAPLVTAPYSVHKKRQHEEGRAPEGTRPLHESPA